ncbi:MAG: Fe-S protein assembly co-chaperone HscB [Bacteroidetes bacterium]|nr:Fe-S protein assembly co-chaperone HscB [Bacteroidota bacterium]
MGPNYFDLFEIPVQLKVDTAALSARFFALSRQFHPDYYAQAGPEEQAGALEQSAQLNKAWKTFNDPDATIKYVLQEKGLLEEEEKYELSPAFLMEVMDINEALMDLDGDAAGEQLLQQINELEKDIYAPVQTVVEQYREGITTREELLQVKEWYFQKKYLDRIRQQLKGMA